MFPYWISPELHRAACRKVARLESAQEQMFIDEWAGAINAGKNKKSPLGHLAASLDSNPFSCHYADQIVEARSARKQTANDS